MGERHISRKRKGNVLSSYINALEKMALTENQQDKVEVCKKQPGHFHENLENGLTFYSLNFMFLTGHNLKL